MDKKVYVCTGTCKAEISEEEFKGGLTMCGTPGCTMQGHTFEERIKCGTCGQVYITGEAHSHK